jgi:hypothetical protein
MVPANDCRQRWKLTKSRIPVNRSTGWGPAADSAATRARRGRAPARRVAHRPRRVAHRRPGEVAHPRRRGVAPGHTASSLSRWRCARTHRRHAVGGGILRVGEAVESLAVADEAVALASDALDGGGVVEQRVAPRAESVHLGPGLLDAHVLPRAFAAHAVQVEEVVVAAEDGEVRGSGEEQRAEEDPELQNASRPWYSAMVPRSSAMRRSWLYFAIRSVRLALPVLIWPARVATARSAMKVSSVSPER